MPTDVPGLCVFGLVASIGVCFSWLLTMTLVPVLLALIPIRRLPGWTRVPSLSIHPLLLRGAFPVALTILLLPGIPRLRIDDGWSQNFRPDHPIVQDVHWFEKESVGVYQFDVMLTREDGRAWTEPGLLHSLAAFQREVDGTPGVTASLSLSDLVRDRAWEMGIPPPTARRCRRTGRRSRGCCAPTATSSTCSWTTAATPALPAEPRTPGTTTGPRPRSGRRSTSGSAGASRQAPCGRGSAAAPSAAGC